MKAQVFRALTIAGSDSGGGAGIQADLKTFAAFGVFGMSAVTAITAQNTREVMELHEVPSEVVEAQIRAVVSDLGADAVKTGMLASPILVDAVANAIQSLGLRNLVVDPVMISKSGAALLRPDAVERLRLRLLPLARVVTPNLPEAEALLGRGIRGLGGMKEAAKEIHTLGASCVVVKGGHSTGEPSDLFYDGERFLILEGERVKTRADHGTGCTFSAALAALLARGIDPAPAALEAKRYVTQAMRNAPLLGSGRSPLDHFFFLKRRKEGEN
jgi:hydroxymethylpyrimidine/phosphomethylpyrimidine kinase